MRLKYHTLKDRLDPGEEADNNEKSMKVDCVVLAAGAWCEYFGTLVGAKIPVRNNFLYGYQGSDYQNAILSS